jgi:peptidoglycan hydrolase-like protein with peptidoglycan-binding domain
MRGLMAPAMAVLVTIAGITGMTLALAAPPVSAQASCTGITIYQNVSNEAVAIPTIGNNTHLDNCDLGVGNQGTAVYWLQFDLNQCYARHLAQDGIYGPLTEAAVRYAQGQVHITQDGIYGPQTRDHIKWVNTGGAGPGACFVL